MIDSRLSPEGFTPPPNMYRQSIQEDVSKLAREDIRLLMLAIVGEETDKQEKSGNKAQLVYTDGYVNKPVTEAQKKVVVIFGDTLAKQAMALVESTLAASIGRLTQKRSGTLANVKGSWSWIFLRNKAPIAFPYDDQGNLTFQSGDMLVLKPNDVPYASMVNMQIVGSGKGLSRKGKVTKRNPTGQSAKRYTNMGFMASTTATLRGNPIFANYRVFVTATSKYAVTGEINKKQGSLCIAITPRQRKFLQ